ncbi:alpha/beta hydrolase [Myxococcaceae bacterium GXIMD 01537]
MVQKGQFLERSTLIPLGREVLEATAHRGTRRPPLLVLPPRPEEGGGMDHVVASELVWHAANAGFPTLRFNHRGVGASQGKRGPLASLVEDADAALQVLLENSGSPSVAVAALHGGAQVALELLARRPEVAGLALVAPADVEPRRLEGLSRPLLVVVGTESTGLPRTAALASAVAGAGGVMEVLEDAGPTFHRSLPALGRAVAGWLQRLSGSGPMARNPLE